jgi:hypothetical protein
VRASRLGNEDVDVGLGRRERPAPRLLEAEREIAPEPEAGHGAAERVGVEPRVDERPERHVAREPGEAVEVGDPHGRHDTGRGWGRQRRDCHRPVTRLSSRMNVDTPGACRYDSTLFFQVGVGSSSSPAAVANGARPHLPRGPRRRSATTWRSHV